MKCEEFQDLCGTLEYWFREEKENECLYMYSNDDLAMVTRKLSESFQWTAGSQKGVGDAILFTKCHLPLFGREYLNDKKHPLSAGHEMLCSFS